MSSLGAINPIDAPQAWDYVTIAGVASPGYCTVSEAKRKHQYDVKTGKGTTGSTTTFVGKTPAQFSIEFFLWDNGTLGTGHNHFDEWDDFIELLKYDPTKKAAQAFDVYHPALASVDIKSVVTESIGSITHKGQGLYSINVEFLEYFPASTKSAVSTPNGSQTAPKWGPGTPPGTGPDSAVAAAQKEAADLAKKAQGIS